MVGVEPIPTAKSSVFFFCSCFTFKPTVPLEGRREHTFRHGDSSRTFFFLENMAFLMMTSVFW